jgi:hypothetical protein
LRANWGNFAHVCSSIGKHISVNWLSGEKKVIMLLNQKLEYYCTRDLDLYDSSNCQVLATQAAKRRHLIILSDKEENDAIQVLLVEDNYVAWLPVKYLSSLQPAPQPYQRKIFSRCQIEQLIPEIIAYTHRAMVQDNYYLWGGTIGPNYDCSGLIQAAFASVGIWLPRDSTQQAEFTEPILASDLDKGDLIFFGDTKINHVALYLRDGYYIHSSGPTLGRNGIGIDCLSLQGDEISQHYLSKVWSYGRVMSSIV